MPAILVHHGRSPGKVPVVHGGNAYGFPGNHGLLPQPFTFGVIEGPQGYLRRQWFAVHQDVNLRTFLGRVDGHPGEDLDAVQDVHQVYVRGYLAHSATGGYAQSVGTGPPPKLEPRRS